MATQPVKLKSATPPRVETMLITPQQATVWLEGNTHNREIRQRRVDTYTATMKAGRWKLNNDAIAFTKDGKLANGQHRLWACVNSQTSFESLVVFGVDDDAYLTMDQGGHRSHADHLHSAGYKDIRNGSLVAAAAQVILRYQSNNLLNSNPVEASAILNLLEKEPSIIEWISEARRAPAGLRGFATPIAAVLTIGAKSHPDKAKDFVAQWITGANLENGSPILTLRQRVLNNPPRRLHERFYHCVAAWNAFVENRPMTKMQSMRSDTFPKILGSEKTVKKGAGVFGLG